MAATDARPIPQKNVAYRVTFPILDADGDLVTGAASLDSEVSKDGGTFTDCTNEATEIATSSGVYFLDLTSTEMNADTVAVIVKTGTAGAKTSTIVLYPEEVGDLRVNVTAYGGTAGTFAAGRPDVNVVRWNNNAVTQAGTGPFFPSVNINHVGGNVLSLTTAQMGVNVVQVSGDAPAADNLETMLDGTGGQALTATFTGNLTGSVASVTAGVTLAASAVQAIWDALTSALTTVGSIGKLLVDNINATISSRSALTAADVNAEVDAALDTAIPATPTANSINERIKAIDDKLPTGTLSDVTTAQVKTQITDALNVDTYAESSGVPASTATIVEKISRLYMGLRNQVTVTATAKTFANDANAAIWKKTLSDDGTTYTETKGVVP